MERGDSNACLAMKVAPRTKKGDEEGTQREAEDTQGAKSKSHKRKAPSQQVQ